MFGVANPAVAIAPLAEAAVAPALAGKRVLVVGGTNGIGNALALRAAAAGASVTVAGRTFRDAGKPGLSFQPLDASSMKDCVRLGSAIEPVPDVRGRRWMPVAPLFKRGAAWVPCCRACRRRRQPPRRRSTTPAPLSPGPRSW